MHFTFTLSVTIDRTEGKFATRDELQDQLTEELDGTLSVIQLEGENGGRYEVTDYNIEVSA